MRLPVKNPNVVFQRVTDGAVLLSTADEVYFGLDPVGAQVWELMTPEVETVDELCRALNERYPEVELATITADVSELFEAMLEAGLVMAPGESSAGGA